MSVLVAPSILSADFARLGDEISRIERSADWVHVDVMDNHFVPNLTLGLPVVSRLAQISSLPLDCHLMIADPDRWAAGYAEAGARNVTFHAEATDDPVQVARSIRAAGGLAGLAIKPGTGVEDYLPILAEVDTVLVMTVEPGFGGQAFMPETLPKVRALRAAITDASLQIRLEVDGGIEADTIASAAEAGADVFVAGSAVYGASDPSAAIDALRRAASQAHSGNGEGSGR